MLNRWIEPELLDVLGDEGVGCICFSPLAQGMLTDKYLGGIPEGSRATRGYALSGDLLTDESLDKIKALDKIARERGQTLAQLALAWTLRDSRVTSTLIGASSVAQLEENVATLDRLDFGEDDLAEIDRYATESGINLWAGASTDERLGDVRTVRDNRARAEGLSATEVGKEIGDARQARGCSGGHGRGIAIGEALLLSIVTIVAAWSGYSAAKWGTESSLALAEGSSTRTKANGTASRSRFE